MKTKYFKKVNPFSKETIFVVKMVSKKQALFASDEEIQIYNNHKPDSDLIGTLKYYNENYDEATKEEFDNFFIKTVNSVNELSKL